MFKICNFLHKYPSKLCQIRDLATATTTRVGVEKLMNKKIDFNFDQVIAFRRSQAKRSIIIQLLKSEEMVKTDDDLTKLLTYFNNLMSQDFNLNILTIHHFKNVIKKKDYALVEFANEREVNYIMEILTGDFQSTMIPIRTRMICLHSSKIYQRRQQGQQALTININQDLTLQEQNIINLKKKLDDCKTLHEQILYIGHYNAMNDFSYRLKFFLASYFEDILKQTFPSAICLPFGSTLNGFGTLNSDLDIVVDLNSIFSDNKRNLQPIFNFQTRVFKTAFTSQRQNQTDRELKLTNLDLIAHILKNYLPDFHNINYITGARIPIIKGEYTAIEPRIEFDISNSDLTSYLMTRLLWSYSMLNPTIVQPLVRLVKQWTQITSLTYYFNNRMRNNLSSYQATILMLIFLVHENLIPNIKKIVREYEILVIDSTKKTKQRPTNNKILNDFDDLPPVQQNTDQEIDSYLAEKIKFNNLDLLMDCRLNNKEKKLDVLFLKFLKFYQNYDYSKKLSLAIDHDFSYIGRHDSPIYVCNPFSPRINALKTINFREFQRFMYAIKKTIESIETSVKNNQKINLIKLFQKIQIPENINFSAESSNNKEYDQDEEMINELSKNNKHF